MKSRKSMRRLGIAYGIAMSLGVFLCVKLLAVTNVIEGADPEVAQMSQEETIREQEVVAMKDTVMGDVYDTNGNLLVTYDKETDTIQYRNDEAYSNTIGFYIPNVGSHLLLGNFRKDLYYADGETDKGRNLTLTLEAEAQEFAYNLINQGSGEKGSITVLDAKTGAVVAMAYNPSFNMQDLIFAGQTKELETGEWKSLVLDGKESLINPLCAPTRPGSIYKVVTSIGILEQNLENVVISDNWNGVWESNGIKIQNANKSAYGDLSYYNAFVKSSNIYFGRMAYEYLGWDVFSDISARCKVGDTLQYDFGTVMSTYKSSMEPFDESAPNEDLAKAAYGYSSLQLTSLQAAMITQGIANKGMMCIPYMLESIHKTTGYEVGEGVYQYIIGDEVNSVSNYYYTKDEITPITTEETAGKIRDAMVKVYEANQSRSDITGVEEGGIVVDGVKYPVAIKTGTADINEIEDYNNIWMVSFAPADDPQYVVVVNRYGVNSQFGIQLFDDVMQMYQVLFAN